MEERPRQQLLILSLRTERQLGAAAAARTPSAPQSAVGRLALHCFSFCLHLAHVLHLFSRCFPEFSVRFLHVFYGCFACFLLMFSQCSPGVLQMLSVFSIRFLQMLYIFSLCVIQVFSRCPPGVLQVFSMFPQVFSRCFLDFLYVFNRCSPCFLQMIYIFFFLAVLWVFSKFSPDVLQMFFSRCSPGDLHRRLKASFQLQRREVSPRLTFISSLLLLLFISMLLGKLGPRIDFPPSLSQ